MRNILFNLVLRGVVVCSACALPLDSCQALEPFAMILATLTNTTIHIFIKINMNHKIKKS